MIKGRLDVNYSITPDVVNSITIGVMNHNSQNSLSNNTTAFLGVSFVLNKGYYIKNPIESKYIGYSYSVSIEFSIIKEGNNISAVIRKGNQYLINTQTVADIDYAMQLILINSTAQLGHNMAITEAYTF